VGFLTACPHGVGLPPIVPPLLQRSERDVQNPLFAAWLPPAPSTRPPQPPHVVPLRALARPSHTFCAPPARIHRARHRSATAPATATVPFRDGYRSAIATALLQLLRPLLLRDRSATASTPRPFCNRSHYCSVPRPLPLPLRSAAATTTAPFRDRYHYRFATALLRNRSATATAPQRLPRPRPRNRCVRVPHARLLDRQRPHFLLRKITVLRSLSRSG